MEILRKYLDRENLSQSEFARILGAQRNQVSFWINGKKRPSLKTLQNISAKTGLDIKKLIASLGD